MSLDDPREFGTRWTLINSSLRESPGHCRVLFENKDTLFSEFAVNIFEIRHAVLCRLSSFCPNIGNVVALNPFGGLVTVRYLSFF